MKKKNTGSIYLFIFMPLAIGIINGFTVLYEGDTVENILFYTIPFFIASLVSFLLRKKFKDFHKSVIFIIFACVMAVISEPGDIGSITFLFLALFKSRAFIHQKVFIAIYYICVTISFFLSSVTIPHYLTSNLFIIGFIYLFFTEIKPLKREYKRSQIFVYQELDILYLLEHKYTRQEISFEKGISISTLSRKLTRMVNKISPDDTVESLIAFSAKNGLAKQIFDNDDINEKV